MKLKTLVDRVAFWRPKAERLRQQHEAIPQPNADIIMGVRLFEHLARQLTRSAARRRVDTRASEASAHWFGTCGSQRRPFTRPAITPGQRSRQLAISTKPAKRIPRIAEKRVSVHGPRAVAAD